MMIEEPRVAAADGKRADILTMALRVVAGATAAVVLVMAALAGQGWFNGRYGLITMHGMLGNIAFLGAIALVVLAFVGWRCAGGAAPFALSLILLALMTAQLGLGYSGRKAAAAAALHIPNGVLLTMVVAALATLLLVGGAHRRPAAASDRI
jgi:hypothetical protein